MAESPTLSYPLIFTCLNSSIANHSVDLDTGKYFLFQKGNNKEKKTFFINRLLKHVKNMNFWLVSHLAKKCKPMKSIQKYQVYSTNDNIESVQTWNWYNQIEIVIGAFELFC